MTQRQAKRTASGAKGCTAPGARRYLRWWAPRIAPSGLRLLDHVAALLPAPAEIVDIGTGTGTLANAAVNRWPAARVCAIDPSDGMLTVARAEADRRLAPADRDRLRFLNGDASDLPLPDAACDVAVSAFVMQYVRPRARAFRETLRVLRPGGVFAFITWMATEAAYPPGDAFDRALADVGVTRPPPTDFQRPLGSPSAAARELRRAGFVNARGQLDWIRLQFTPRSYLALVERHSDLELFRSLAEDTRVALRAAALDHLAALGPDGLDVKRPLVVALGVRPS